MLEVLVPGSRVFLGGADHSIPAVINAVNVREGLRITYECVWWDGNNRRTDWLSSFEIVESSGSSKAPIGFKSC